MGQSDKQFVGFLRLLITRIRSAVAVLQKGDNERALKLLQEIVDDLQGTLED